MPRPGGPGEEGEGTAAARCPTGALRVENGRTVLERAKCIHCFRCVRGVARPVPWEDGFEWAALRGPAAVVPKAQERSLHIRVIDAGDCGACLNEVKLLNNPFYNMHRLGFFITPTPRQADILLVVGTVTDHMKTPLLKAYDAMPGPKRVMAVGSCALTGGVFGPGFAAGSGVAAVLPVDVEVPGWPPPPLAVLHGLLAVAGRKPADRIARRGKTAAPAAGKKGGQP
jgi:Ni,Fe-hydrogenase III small subunit